MFSWKIKTTGFACCVLWVVIEDHVWSVKHINSIKVQNSDSGENTAIEDLSFSFSYVTTSSFKTQLDHDSVQYSLSYWMFKGTEHSLSLVTSFFKTYLITRFNTVFLYHNDWMPSLVSSSPKQSVTRLNIVFLYHSECSRGLNSLALVSI